MGKQLYYKLSIKWTHHNDEVFKFWRPDSNGYTYLLDEAGKYEDCEIKINEGIFSVPVEIIDGFVVEVMDYSSNRIYKVCPNRGFIRMELGLTIFDFKKFSDKREKDIYFQSYYSLFDVPHIFIEKSKKIDTGYYKVSMQPNSFINEEFYYSDEFAADSRNKAITQAYKEWDIKYIENDINYIQFKNIVSVKKVYEYIFDKWEGN